MPKRAAVTSGPCAFRSTGIVGVVVAAGAILGLRTGADDGRAHTPAVAMTPVASAVANVRV